MADEIEYDVPLARDLVDIIRSLQHARGLDERVQAWPMAAIARSLEQRIETELPFAQNIFNEGAQRCSLYAGVIVDLPYDYQAGPWCSLMRVCKNDMTPVIMRAMENSMRSIQSWQDRARMARFCAMRLHAVEDNALRTLASSFCLEVASDAVDPALFAPGKSSGPPEFFLAYLAAEIGCRPVQSRWLDFDRIADASDRLPMGNQHLPLAQLAEAIEFLPGNEQPQRFDRIADAIARCVETGGGTTSLLPLNNVVRHLPARNQVAAIQRVFEIANALPADKRGRTLQEMGY